MRFDPPSGTLPAGLHAADPHVPLCDGLLAEELLESDRRYFESAAELEPLGGAVLARMPALQGLPAACVVQRVAAAALPLPPGEWLDQLERRLLGMGYARVRLYVRPSGAAPALAAVLAERGYRASTEIGFLGRALHTPALPAGYRFDPVTTQADWVAKRALHRACAVGPDGHASAADEWVEMERRKTEAGYMQPYLLRRDGTACGTVGASASAHLLRLKNLVIHPEHQKQGVGRTAVRCVAGVAHGLGKRAIGVFGIEHTPGAALYRAAGFHASVLQTEWTRRLTAP